MNPAQQKTPALRGTHGGATVAAACSPAMSGLACSKGQDTLLLPEINRLVLGLPTSRD
jgi:hypothetical protein